MRLSEHELETELREMRPKTEERFVAGLDARVAEGFPRGVEPPPVRLWRRLGTVPPRRLVPVFGAAASLLVVSAVAVSQSGLSGGGAASPPPPIPAATPDVTSKTVEPSAPVGTGTTPQNELGSSAGQGTAAPGPRAGGVAPRVHSRKVERSATLELSTAPDQLRDVADGVISVIDRNHGIVLSSQISDQGPGAGAQFDLRVPATRVDTVLAQLSDLAHVSARTQNATDVTGSFVSSRKRLQAARHKVASLEDRLQTASGSEALAIKDQLRAARTRVIAERRQLTSTAGRVRMSALTLTITPDGSGSGGSTLHKAAHTALRVLVVSAGIALVSLAVLLPLSLLALAAWLGGRAALRRSRERALDRAAAPPAG